MDKKQKIEKLKEYVKPGNTFCPFLFLHYFVDTDKKSKFCCLDIDSISNSVVDYNDSIYVEARDNILNNKKLTQCTKCYDSEEKNIISLRQKTILDDIIEMDRVEILFDQIEKHNQGLDIQPLWYDLRISNNCNLSCIMCGPQYSSTWAKKLGIEHKHLSFDPDIKISPNTYKIQLAGGEPFMIKKFSNFLEKINNLNCEIIVNTNATIINQTLLDQLKRFKNTTIVISVDGYGELNEKIRTGTIWSTVVKNIKIFQKENFNLLVNTCVQKDNINHLYELGVWLEGIGIDDWMLSRLFNPVELKWENQDNIDIENLKQTLKLKSIQRNNISISFLENAINSQKNNCA